MLRNEIMRRMRPVAGSAVRPVAPFQTANRPARGVQVLKGPNPPLRVAAQPVDAAQGGGRSLAFKAAVGLVFLNFSMLHQLSTLLLHVNLYLLFVVGIPAVLGFFLTGGLPRALRCSPVRWWLLYACWIAAACPFSIWRGGSFAHLNDYVRTVIPVLLVISGLTLSWRETQVM